MLYLARQFKNKDLGKNKHKQASNPLVMPLSECTRRVRASGTAWFQRTDLFKKKFI